MASNTQTILFFVALISFSQVSLGLDSGPLLDFCVACNASGVSVNGSPCKDPKDVVADDFYLSGFDKPGNISSPSGFKVTTVNVFHIPGINTLGISMSRIDYGVGGVNPLHSHPRASEIITVMEGQLEVGFVTTTPEYKHYSKKLKKGDVFVFPLGLLHYQRNTGDAPAYVICAFNSQNGGLESVSYGVFGTKPPIADDILMKAFQMEQKTVDFIKTKYKSP